MIERREVLRGFGGLVATAVLGKFGARVADAEPLAPPELSPRAIDFPRKDDFLIEEGSTYLNAAYTHPIPKASMAAAVRAAGERCGVQPPAAGNPKAQFAELINARPEEIAYVSCTSAGENLVVQALELDRKLTGNVVTDGLHFEGALLHLLELKKQGLDVRVVRPTSDCRIDIHDLERVVDRKTRLVEVSSASMYNGFQHDLKAVCDLAHAHGAYVYADIIHSAGAEPFDVKASGVDFAACSTFKWLMGDFGLGFLYTKQELLERIRRPVVGYYEAARLDAFYPPNIPGGPYAPIGYELEQSATGMFETGTLHGSPGVAIALLSASLGYIKELGVASIQAHRQPLIRKLQQEVPRLGFRPVTPLESTSGNVTFVKTNVGQSDLPRKLKEAKINVRIDTHWMRISPSVYNDTADIDRFLEAIS